MIQNSNTIDLNGVDSSYTTGTNDSGFYFSNNSGPLTITDSKVYSNDEYGIYINFQNGPMLLDGLSVTNNGGTGVEVLGNSIGSFTLRNSTIAENGYNWGGNGFDVNLTGNVILDHVTSNENEDYGGELDVSGDITVTDSTFYHNYDGDGLAVWCDGTFSAQNSTFDQNEYTGLFVYCSGDINVDGILVSNNVESWEPDVYGAELYSAGNIVVSNSTFNTNNTGAGLVAEAGQVLAVAHSTANGNGTVGFALMGSTSVSALGLTASGNAMSGIWVNNSPDVPVGVYVSSLTGNGEWGIDYSTSSGTLTLCADHYSGNSLGEIGAGAGATVIDYVYYPCANPGGLTGGTGGAVTPTTPATGPVTVEVPYVADFTTEDAQTGTAAFDSVRGLIFQLIDTAGDGGRTLWAQASITAGLVPDGTTATFLQKAEDELPATLPDGSTFVGPAFTLGFSGLTQTSGNMEIKFLVLADLAIPAGQSLAIVEYDASGAWVTLSTVVAGDYATAYTDALGTFALVLVTP